MKVLAVLIISFALILSSSVLAGDSDKDQHVTYHHQYRDHGLVVKSLNSWEIGLARFKIDDGDILIRHIDDRNQRILITANRELFVNDEQVELNAEQQELLDKFYDLTMQIHSEARDLARDGVKLGAKGAKLGIKAIGLVFRMLFTSYTEDDLEEDIEREAEMIEAKGELLEERAEIIEDLSDEWGETGLKLKSIVPQLDRLEWLESDHRYGRRSYGRSRLD
jgi:hypothetical protein